tara:strand:- start:38 stop:223 length:186 start_codon:yes stop_codon:yes gene_type:complete
MLAVVAVAVQDVEMAEQVAAVIKPVVEEHLIQEQQTQVVEVEQGQELQDQLVELVEQAAQE